MATPMRKLTLSFVEKWSNLAQDFRLLTNYFKGPPPGALAVIGSPSTNPSAPSSECKNASQILDSIFDGLLHAVPKFRRSVEKRLHRKHRFTNFVEHGTPKTNLIPCLECGNFKEKGHLCQHCYEKVRTETKELQAKMGDTLEFDVPRSEVEFVYKDETPAGNGFYTVKVSKDRPTWFPRRLLNKTGS